MIMKTEFGIYIIKNVVSGDSYIGSTKQLRRRRNKHLSALRNNYHENYKLQMDYNTYGEECFQWSVLEYVKSEKISDLQIREQFYIDELQPYYNIRPQAVNSYWEYQTEESKRLASERCRQKNLGRKQSQIEKDRRAASLREYWATHPAKTISQEMREHLSKINKGKGNPNWGLKRSKKTRELMSQNIPKVIYTFKSPDGELFTFKNLSKAPIPVPYGALRNLYRGLTESYKGWTFVGSEKTSP